MKHLFLSRFFVLAFWLCCQALHVEGQSGPDCGQTGQIPLGFTFNLPPSGEADIQACWFGRFGCGNTGGFSYSFSSDPEDTVLTLTCEDLGQTAVDLWIWDAAGNGSAAETFVIVQDNFFTCPGQGAPCAPVVQVINGMNLSFPSTGTATLSARQLDWGSYLVNCAQGLGLSFSFSSDPADSLRTYTCPNDQGLQAVTIWATAESGQQAYAETFIRTQAPLAIPDCSDIPACAPQLTGTNSLLIHIPPTQQAVLSPDLFFKEVKAVCPGGAFTLSFSADIHDTKLTLGCNDLGQYPIDVWVTDALGNQNYLQTFVVMQDPSGWCDEPLTIAFSPNDMACDADGADLTPYIGAGPVCFNNIEATVQQGEVAPTDGDCFAQNAWCDGGEAHNSVWFVVYAPPSGSLKIDTDGVLDLQLAVWQASSCNDLLAGGAQLMSANDDQPGDPHNATLEVNLAPGKYHPRADGHGISETGSFYLSLTELTATTEQPGGLDFSIFPNPAGASVTLSCATLQSGPVVWLIYDALGRELRRETLPAGFTEKTVSLEAWPKDCIFTGWSGKERR
ncbi:MAG: hypothetical protein IPG32_14270 [Saprospirales bacterium]|nr:hypothetical protein [Saprospirales bacterium]